MRFARGRFSRSLLLFLLGLAGGLLGESLLLLQAHCAKIESLLLEDFRVLAFLNGKPEEGRVRVAEEKLRALSGVEALRFISPEESLSEISSRDPELLRSVALLGDNPLPGAFEVQLEAGHIARLPDWTREAQAIAELGDIRYKPLQARTILQVQFYGRFVTLALSLAGFIWLSAGARRLWIAADFNQWARAPFDFPRELALRSASAGTGTALGMILAALFAYPAQSLDLLSAWPPLVRQAALLVAGTLGGWMLTARPRTAPKRAARGSHARGEEDVEIGGAAVLLLGFLLLLPAAVRAADVEDKRKELEEVRAALEQKRKEVENYRKQQDEAENDLSRLRSEKESARRAVSSLRDKRRSAEAVKAELGMKLAALTMAQGKGMGLLSGEVSGYARHLKSQWPRYGTSELWEESFRRAAVREKANYLRRLRVSEAQTSEAREKARLKDRELQEKALRALAELKSREDNYGRKETAYKEARSQVSQTLKEIQELEDSTRALTSLIKALDRKAPAQTQQTAASKVPPVPKYSLPWPVVGKVVRRFGKEKVAELKTWVIHNGIEIDATPQAKVQCVEDGKVIFAGPFRSYGNVIIVDHGYSFFSIYGKLRESFKRKGDRVSAGAELATADSLYFELRQGSEAIDPLVWLKKL